MAEKKKILYIVEAMGGGVFTYIVDLANELVDTYDMYIAYAVRKQTPSNYKDYFDKRIHLIEVKNFGRAINPVKDFASLFEVKRIASEINPDVIHLHSSKAGVIGRIAFNGKIPMFYTPHGYSFLMENYKPMKRAMFKLIETVCAKRKCTTISCSVGEHQETLKLTQHATYVNNGINMAELKEIVDRTDKVEHPFTVYTLGRICYQKNPTMFNAIAELLPDVRFVWIGDGELRSELTSKNIEITGWADRATAIKYAVNLHPIRQSFKRRNSLSGMPLPLLVRKQSRMKIFKTSCRMNTTFSSKPNVGVIAICRRNGTSSYRSVLWEKAAKENVWKDSLFRTPRRICGTRKNPY